MTDMIQIFQNPGSDDETIIGTSGDDLITGGIGNDSIVGGGGNDTIDGGAGIDTVDFSASVGPISYSGTIYSASVGTPEGDDVLYGVESIIGSAAGDYFYLSSNGMAIDAGGGADTIVVSQDETITAGAGDDAISQANGYYAAGNSIDGGSGNDTVSITNYYGSGNNTLLGGSGDDSIYEVSLYTTGNSLAGGDGNDTIDATDYDYNYIGGSTIDGGAGNDSLSLTTYYGHESLVGGSGDDTIVSLVYSNGNATLAGGAGNDSLVAGAGLATVDYSNDAAGVMVDLGTGSATDGSGGHDTLSNIRGVIGSAFADTLIGGVGNDTLSGGAGDDSLDGGAGLNAVSFANDAGGVTIDLALGTVTDGYGGHDTIANFLYVDGSGFADVIKGDANNNYLSGLGGNDTFVPSGGNDTIDGNAGFDVVNFSGETGAVNVSNYGSSGSYNTPSGSGQLNGIEGFVGSNFSDYFTLYYGNQSLAAGDGNDTINAEYGYYGNFTIDGGAGNDYITGYSAAAALSGGTGNDTIYGYYGADTIVGGSGDDYLYGYSATITVDYSADPAGVLVDLAAQTATDGFGGHDTIIGISRVVGSAFADTITGDGYGNVLTGGAGNDLLSGGDGSDTLIGGMGDDTLDGTTGFADVADYSADPTGINVNLTTGLATDGFGGHDSLANIDKIIGSAFDDTIIGGGAATIVGGAGNDSIDGAALLSYADSPGGIVIDVAAGTVTDGFGGHDTIANIARIEGSAFADTVIGGSGNELYFFSSGNDSIDGGRLSCERRLSGLWHDLQR